MQNEKTKNNIRLANLLKKALQLCPELKDETELPKYIKDIETIIIELELNPIQKDAQNYYSEPDQKYFYPDNGTEIEISSTNPKLVDYEGNVIEFINFKKK